VQETANDNAAPIERGPKEKQEHPVRLGAETLLMRAFGSAFERASWGACRYAGAWLGMAFWGALKRRRGIAIRNVQLAFPGMSEAAAQRVARRSVQNFAMTFCEFLHLRTASPEEVRSIAYFRGLEYVEAGFQRERGVILLTAHLGNWEVMGARSAQEFPLTVVARPTSNSGVQAHIDATRRAAGMEILSKYDTARGSIQVLRKNGGLGILPDQHAGSEGMLSYSVVSRRAH
jgi:KDO2-lipid IV(A) lauroyltransferase